MTSPTRSRRLLAAGTLALLLTAATAACGGDGGDEGGTDTTTSTRVDETTTTASTTTEDDVTTTTEDEVTTTTEDEVTSTTDGEPSGDPQDYVDALVATIDGAGEEFFEPGQVECLAESFVDVIGVDALEAAGISPDELAEGTASTFPPELGLDEAEANELYDQFGACEIDLVEQFSKIFAAGRDLTAEEQACLEGVGTDENLRASFVADVLGEELEDDPLDAITTCVGPNEPAEPGGN